MLNYSDILKVESIAGGSPFYLVDRRRFESNFDDLTAAFSARYQPFVLAYSYKTNYMPYLCQIIKHKGGWAEVVSRMEYDLALKIGQNPSRVIFNGPLKTAEDIELALKNGSLVNVDSESELELIAAYAAKHPDKHIPIGLRINITLSDEAGQSHIQNALKISRFGFDPGELNSQFLVLNSKLQRNNIRIISLHGHTSTTNRSTWCFEVITKTLCDIAEKHFPQTVEYINIGGGFFGKIYPGMPFKDAPSFGEYARSICDVLRQSTWVQQKKPTLVIEPGVAMAADAVSFVTKVVSVKTIRGQVFTAVDGSAFHTKPTFHSLNLPYEVITRNANPSIQTYTVVGSTCMEKDILLNDITAPLPQPGDYIKIDNVGAYTLVMTPPFIHTAPAVVADEDGGRVKLIRRKQTLDEIFSNYIF